MAFRFWRRIRIAPGVTLNLSKSGGSLSFGPRGAKFTIGPRGKRATVGIPGTGLFYTSTLRTRRSSSREGLSQADSASPTVRPEDRLDLGLFRRLITPDDEKALVDGLRELALGDEDMALEHLDITNPVTFHFGITPEKLTRPHESKPWNPIIANVFYRAASLSVGAPAPSTSSTGARRTGILHPPGRSRRARSM